MNSFSPKGLGLFLFGVSAKRNKKKILCELCASSEAGGEHLMISIKCLDGDTI
jgi:hypothetical protein